MENYEKILDRISKSSSVPREEIERKIEAKRAKLSGLISKEGAAQIVAAELGIVFDNEKIQLSEILHGMKRVNVVGKIIRLFPIRDFNKNGREGRVASFILADESSNARVTLWDTNHISLIEEKKIVEGDVIEISNGSVRNGEVHLSAFSDIKKSDEKLDNVKTQRVVKAGSFSEARAGMSFKVRAVIVQAFDPKFFEREGQKKALLNVVLDDGTETMRAVMFGDTIKKLGLTDEEIFAIDKFKEKKDKIIGEEKQFSGNFRTNQYFNNIEMTIDSIEEVDVNQVIKELEARA